MRKGNTNALDQPDLSEIYTISYALSKKLPIHHFNDKSNNGSDENELGLKVLGLSWG